MKKGQDIMDTLIQILKQIESSPIPTPEYPNDTFMDTTDDLVDRAVGYATALFVTDNGHPEFEIMDKFQNETGYAIFPLERDRFGWLTAGLQTKKGIIVFG